MMSGNLEKKHIYQKSLKICFYFFAATLIEYCVNAAVLILTTGRVRERVCLCEREKCL
jgi:hypothetical protein